MANTVESSLVCACWPTLATDDQSWHMLANGCHSKQDTAAESLLARLCVTAVTVLAAAEEKKARVTSGWPVSVDSILHAQRRTRACRPQWPQG